jgi:orotate phosphoribosyltransferase-like protein
VDELAAKLGVSKDTAALVLLNMSETLASTTKSAKPATVKISWTC